MKAAQIKVFKANCIYAGVCAEQLFVYTPGLSHFFVGLLPPRGETDLRRGTGMYSSTNRDFVRSTVVDFYEMFRQTSQNPDNLAAFSFTNDTIDSEMVCPLDDLEMELKVRNEAMKSSCASVQLDTLKKALRIVRIVVDKMAEFVYIQFQLVICFFRLLIPSGSVQDVSQVVKEIQFWFDRLIQFMIQALEEIANILFQLVFDTGPFGKALKDVISFLCTCIYWIMQAWNHFFCHVAKIILAPLLEIIVSIIEAIVRLIGSGWEAVSGLRKIIRMINDMDCNVTVTCAFPDQKPMGLEYGALPVATRCWADYSPEIDSTDAFSCTRSDTCRVPELVYGKSLDYTTGLLLEDGNQIVCDQCPLQPGGVVNSFGCDVYTKQCTCNRPKLERSYCTSNMECRLQGDAESMCALVGDFSTGESFGTLACSQCMTSQPVCLVSGKDSSKGICSCMLQSTPVQSCSMQDVSQRVTPDASQMCSISLDFRRISQSTTISMDWNSLAVGPCILISQANSYCYNVPGYGYLVVGLGVIQTSGGRRLLSTAADDFYKTGNLQQLVKIMGAWQHTSSPCNKLAASVQDLKSITDQETLRKCIQWRFIGQTVLQKLNITWEADDTYLLSVSDFVRVISSGRNGTLLFSELAFKWPHLLLTVAKESGMQDLWTNFWKAASRSTVTRAWAQTLMSRLHHSSSSQNATTLYYNNISKIRNHDEIMHMAGFMQAEAFGFVENFASLLDETEAGNSTGNVTTNMTRGSSRRHLLQSNDNFVRAYSAWVAATKGYSNIQIGQSRLTDSWLQGPLLWPPRFDHLADSGKDCQAADEAVAAALQVADILRRYYTSEEYLGSMTTPPWDLQSNSPSVYMSPTAKDKAFAQSTPRPQDDRKDLPAATFYYVIDGWVGPTLGKSFLDNVTLAAASFFNLDAGVAPGDSFTAGTILKNSLVCDFEAVTFCRKESMPSRKNLVVSFMISYGIYLGISFLLDATMITGIIGPVWRIFGLAIFVPWMAFQMAYGVGPACFPMVPTCLLQDVMLFVQQLFPERITWPDSLQLHPGCASSGGQQPCLRSCRSDPFYFTSWESSISWATCNWFVKDCDKLVPMFPDVVRSWTQLPQAFMNHSHIASEDLWHGHQFCFFMTLGQLLPYIFLAIGILYALVQIVMLPVIVFSAGMQFAWQAIAYTHIDS